VQYPRLTRVHIGGPGRGDSSSGRGLDAPGGAVTTIPPPNPTHGIGDVLRLVGAIRAIAYEPSYRSEPDDQMRRIRDLFYDYDHPEDDDA
jgi:hypothetical protein